MAAVTTTVTIANATDMEVYHNMTNSAYVDSDYSYGSDYCDGYRDVDFLMRNIWMYVGYPILILGTVGHSLVIVLFLLNKSMRSLPLSIFLMTMSAAGLLALYVGLLPTIIKHQTCHHERFEDKTTEAGCQVFMAAIYFSLQLYSWMEASVAVERMCAVRWALTYHNISTQRNNAIITGVIAIVLMAVNSIHFKIFGTSHHFCDVEDVNLFKAWQYVHSTVYILLPVSLMIPANVVTLHTMYRSPMKNLSEVKRAKPVAIMMLILNCVFVVTTTPILVGDYEHLEASDYETVQVAWVVSRLMMYLGCSLTFLVYLAVAARFRKALSRLLASGKNKMYAVLVTMSSVGGRVSGKSEGYHAAQVAGTTIGEQVNSFTMATTDGKV